MTNAEYNELYQAAQLQAGTLTLKARKELLKAYKAAAKLAAEAVENATSAGLSDLTSSHWSAINTQLQAGADSISNTLESTISTYISKSYSTIASIDEDYIMDAVTEAQIDSITSAGVAAISSAIDETLLTYSASRVYSNGYTLSESIWNLYDSSGKPTGVNGDYQYRIKNLILTGQAQGRDVVDIAKDIQTYVAYGKDAVFTAGNYGKLIAGTGEYKARISGTVDWRALRIVRSELYASLQQAGLQDGPMNPACQDQYNWKKNKSNPTDPDGSRNASGQRCIDLENGNPYTLTTAPGHQHPNCGCRLEPVLMDHEEFVSDLKNWVPGSGPEYLDTWYRTVYSTT